MDTGFCDASHFTKTFREHLGVTPSQFAAQVTRSEKLDRRWRQHVFSLSKERVSYGSLEESKSRASLKVSP